MVAANIKEGVRLESIRNLIFSHFSHCPLTGSDSEDVGSSKSGEIAEFESIGNLFSNFCLLTAEVIRTRKKREKVVRLRSICNHFSRSRFPFFCDRESDEESEDSVREHEDSEDDSEDSEEDS